MRIRSSAAAAFAAASLLGGCSSTAPTTSVTPAPAPAHAPAAHEKHWAYTSTAETAGPAEWGSLPGDAACATGQRQSPVDLGSRPPFPVEAKDLPNLVFKYGKTALHLVNNGHTIQADVDKGSSVEIDGATWSLLQFHFHAPSEHTLDGLRYPMEMHLVHAGPDGKPGLVVGVLLVQGGDTPALAPVLSSVPREKGARRDDAAATIDLATLLPANRAYFAYDGSLTTPPCTEGIRWFVLQSPGGITAEQLGAFVSLPHMTPSNRPTQPLSGRKVLLDTTP
jgi:carbonic anhydrase